MKVAAEAITISDTEGNIKPHKLRVSINDELIVIGQLPATLKGSGL